VALKTVLLISILMLSACSSNPPQVKQTQQAPPPDPVRISQFYASPATPTKGEKTMLCYGVENATEVRIDPPVDRVWPAASHCLEVKPTRTTTYTLTALRGSETVSKSITVQIGPPVVKIIEVSIDKLKIVPGETVTICYKVQNAKQVTLHPGTDFGSHSPDVGCVTDKPAKTTTYTVVATGAGGSTDTEHVTATVQ
jgi:hypothetical protein